jgi:hypothetical protein
MIDELYNLLAMVEAKYGEESDEYVGLADEISCAFDILRNARISAEKLLALNKA